MKHLLVLGVAARLLVSLDVAQAQSQPSLNPHLESLRPFLGKTWRGVFEGSKPDKPTVDVARWERVLNGQGVRLLHSINQGAYGGETMFMWNDKAKQVEFYYFTTGGYLTTGTLQVVNNKLVTHEDVKGEAGGVTEVRATTEILAAGSFHVKAEYLKNGQWSLGHEVTYHEDPSAEVVFK